MYHRRKVSLYVKNLRLICVISGETGDGWACPIQVHLQENLGLHREGSLGWTTLQGQGLPSIWHPSHKIKCVGNTCFFRLKKKCGTSVNVLIIATLGQVQAPSHPSFGTPKKGGSKKQVLTHNLLLRI